MTIISSQIIFRTQITGGVPNNIAATVNTHVNTHVSILASTPTNTIAAPVVIAADVVGGVPNVMNATIVLYKTINGDSFGVTSSIVATIPFGFSGSAGIFETLLGNIHPRSTISGFVVPFGVVSSPINISGFVTAASPDLINSEINISSNILAAQPVIGAASASISFGRNIQGTTTLPQGTMMGKINFARRIVGQFAVQATITNVPITISGLSSNRAQSFTAPGQPTPAAYSLGQVASPIIFTSHVTADTTISTSIVGATNNVINITGQLSGLSKVTGVITSKIVFSTTMGNSGVQVAKTNPYTVLARSRYGVEVVKANPVVVLSHNPTTTGNEIIAKSVAYAVIIPSGSNTVSTTSNYGYTAIFFQ